MIDLLAVCAHPDGLEAGLGGTFIKAKQEGLCTGLVLFTKGEAGGHAEAELRMREAEKAASEMELDYFAVLDFPDAGLFYSPEAVQALIPHLRKCEPRYLFTLLSEDYHPDHAAVSKITEAARFCAGLKKYSPDGKEWHCEDLLYFGVDDRRNRQRPELYVDISVVIDRKRRILEAHASQQILEPCMRMAEAYGQIAGVGYAEGLYLKAAFTVRHPGALFSKER